MIENILELVVGQLLDAIYFALFLIFTKNIKEKRLLFVFMVSVEYILLFQALPYQIWSHILFFIITYIVLKILYKESAQITDIFTMGIASLCMIVISAVIYMIIWKLFNSYPIALIVERLAIIIFMLMIYKKLPNIQKIYKKLWNRNDSKDKKIKSTTFRAINIVIFNISFFIINLGMIFMLIQKGGA